jgi:hypothetical protein
MAPAQGPKSPAGRLAAPAELDTQPAKALQTVPGRSQGPGSSIGPETEQAVYASQADAPAPAEEAGSGSFGAPQVADAINVDSGAGGTKCRFLRHLRS